MNNIDIDTETKEVRSAALRRMIAFILKDMEGDRYGEAQITRETLLSELGISLSTLKRCNRQLRKLPNWKVSAPGGAEITTYTYLGNPDKD